MNDYLPGSHIIATLTTGQFSLLNTYSGFRRRVNELIVQHGLQQLGEVYHDFDPGGFTGVVCLSESHISVHTWPEHRLVNLDIYLSNYLRDNDGTTQAILDGIVAFFGATVSQYQKIKR